MSDFKRLLRKVLLGVAKFVAAVVILLLVGALVMALVLYNGKRDMQKACALAPVGADVSVVKAALSRDGYHMLFDDYRRDTGKQYVAVLTRKGMGRYACMIYHDGEKVIWTEINFAD